MLFRQVPPSFQIYLRRFTFIFIGLAVLAFISEIFFPDRPVLNYLAKPAVMGSLLIFYLQKQRQRHYLALGWMLGAIIGSLVGDIFLMFDGKIWFILGLGFLLGAHVCYVFVFRNSSHRQGEHSLLKRKPWSILPFVIYSLWLISLMWPLPKGLGWLMVVYAIIITGMAIAALNRWKKTPDFSFGLVFMGAMLFLVSNSLIAVDRFGPELLSIPGVSFMIMLTYTIAQYLLVTGILVYDWHPRPQVSQKIPSNA